MSSKTRAIEWWKVSSDWVRFAIPASLTLLCATCVTDVARNVAIEPAPAPDVVQFVMRDRNLVYGLTVMTCRGRAVWTISNAQLGPVPSRVTYGVTPAGFVNRTGPEPLKPGCYDVIVSGPSRARFNVGEDGRLLSPTAPVVSGASSEWQTVVIPSRQPCCHPEPSGEGSSSSRQRALSGT